MKKTGFVYTDIYLNHKTGAHPESADRLCAITSSLRQKHLSEHLTWVNPPKGLASAIETIHTSQYIDRVEASCLDPHMPFLDPDTILSSGSYNAALFAVGAVTEAIDRVLDGDLDNAFCAVRPPGHHAERDHGMGFCLFNNIAVGAKHALLQRGLERVLILDWDVHHGNGTQNSFYNDPHVYYISIHQYPHYPGTGKAKETGAGNGKGYTSNFPIPSGSGHDEYLTIMEKSIFPIIRSYKPEIILISAGFDAHVADPLADMRLSAETYYQMTKGIVDLADEVCEGRVVSTLEGGYNMEALGESVAMHLTGLLKSTSHEL